MVSAKEDRFVKLPPLQQQIEHISRVRSPVDIVADKDDDRTADRTVRTIGIDCGQQPLQKIGAAVYVTHGIYSDTFGERRMRLAAFSKPPVETSAPDSEFARREILLESPTLGDGRL